MPNEPFLSFLSDLSKNIAVEREHKQLMEKINSNEEEQKDNSLEKFLNTLKTKLDTPLQAEQKLSNIEDIIKKDLEDVVIEVNYEEAEDASFDSFVGKLKNILETKPIENTEVPALSSEQITVKDKEEEDVNAGDYVGELEKIKNGIAIEKEDSKVTEIKKLIEEYAEKYLKRAIGYAGESGGGSVAQQFANGGTMNGNLNVTGNYLSGGVNLLNIFGSGGGGNSAVNALVQANSGSWDSTYTTVSTFSATWSTGIQTLTFNNATYDLSITSGNTVNLGSLKDNLSEIAAASGSWNSVYTSFKANSAKYDSTFSTVTSNSGFWSNAYTNLVSNSALYLGIENVKMLSDSEYSLDLNQNTIYTKQVSSENVFTYSNFVSGRTLTIYLSANHQGSIAHYFPLKTYFGSNGTSNLVYTFSGYATKITIQNVGDYFLGSTFLIPINVTQYTKAGDYMLMENFGFIFQEDDYRIILD